MTDDTPALFSNEHAQRYVHEMTIKAYKDGWNEGRASLTSDTDQELKLLKAAHKKLQTEICEAATSLMDLAGPEAIYEW